MRRVVLVLGLVALWAWWSGRLPRHLDVPGLIAARAACDPSYPTVCLPPPPPHRPCGELDLGTFKVFGADPHGLDPDGDGVACNH